MTILREYFVKDEQTEALRDAATLVAGMLGQPQPIRSCQIGEDTILTGGGITYRDHNIMIQAQPDALIISQIREKGARCIVAHFSMFTCWADTGVWQDHLFSLALQLTVQQVVYAAS